MSSAGILRGIALELQDAGIPFMLTGSFAAAYHGVPRATLDIDLVIDSNEPQLRTLVAALEAAGQYVSIDAALVRWTPLRIPAVRYRIPLRPFRHRQPRRHR